MSKKYKHGFLNSDSLNAKVRDMSRAMSWARNMYKEDGDDIYKNILINLEQQQYYGSEEIER